MNVVSLNLIISENILAAIMISIVVVFQLPGQMMIFDEVFTIITIRWRPSLVK